MSLALAAVPGIAVVYATGASDDRSLGIPGEGLPGSHAAAEFVAWYNGHPDFADRTFDLSTKTAVVIGNGNVALDLARILTSNPETLAHTDIADHALEALRRSEIEEVLVIGRRGISEAKFTTPELIALADSSDFEVVVVKNDAFASMSSSRKPDVERATKMRVLEQLADRKSATSEIDRKGKTIILEFCTSPVSIFGEESVTSIRLARNVLAEDEHGTVRAEATDDQVTVETGLVLRSVGYRGREIPGVPFDFRRGVIPNTAGRVVDDTGAVLPGVYVAGWIKRGPSGVIGTNRKCAAETVHALLDDLAADRLARAQRGVDDLNSMLAEKVPDSLNFSDWTAVDFAEVNAGSDAGRPRVKMVDPVAMRKVIHDRPADRY